MKRVRRKAASFMKNETAGLAISCGVTVFLNAKGGFHFSEDVGEAEVAAGVIVGEALVVEAEEVEESGVEVVHVKTAGDRFVPDFIGGSVGVSGFGSTSGEPGGKAARVVVPSVFSL